MKTFRKRTHRAFTLAEMLMSIACGSLILAACVTASVAMQRSFAAVEAYSMTEGDQLRVLDYIAMDCRRAIAGSIPTSSGTLTTPVVSNGSWSSGTWTVNSSSPQTLILSLPVYYNASSSNAAYAPTLTSGSLSYGSGTVTVSYYQNGTNFSREVTIKNSSGTVTSDVTSTIARNVSTFTVTPIDHGNWTVTCNIMFFPNFTHMTGSGTWRSGGNTPSNSTGVNGDWYVINTTASNQTTVGDVYFMSGGSYSKVQNVKATTAYCNTFLRNASAR